MGIARVSLAALRQMSVASELGSPRLEARPLQLRIQWISHRHPLDLAPASRSPAWPSGVVVHHELVGMGPLA